MSPAARDCFPSWLVFCDCGFLCHQFYLNTRLPETFLSSRRRGSLAPIAENLSMPHQKMTDPMISGHPDNQTSPVEAAILSTVAYRDCFRCAISLAEMHRFLHGHACTIQELQEALDRTELCQGRLETDGLYYWLKGRRENLTHRQIAKRGFRHD